MTDEHEKCFHYFAFGSNLLSRRIRIHNPSSVAVGVGKLDGFRFTFASHWDYWAGATANIVANEAAHVYGVVWRLSSAEMASLDKQESGYHAIQVPIVMQTPTKQVISCRTYVMDEKHVVRAPEPVPSAAYKLVVLSGAREHGLPSHYVCHVMDDPHPDNGVLDCGPTELIQQLIREDQDK